MEKCNNSNTDKTPTDESLIQNIRNVIGAQERFIKLCEEQQPTSDKEIESTEKRPQQWWKRFLTLMKLNKKNQTNIHILLFILLLSTNIGCDRENHNNYTQEQKKAINNIVFANRNIDSLTAILNKFTNDKNYLGEIIAYKELGKCYREASRFTEAVDCHKNEARIAAQIGDTLELIQALNNIGTNFRRMGILDEASSYHYQAFVYCERYSNKQDSIAMKNRVVSLNGIGNVQMTLGNMEIADSVFRLALIGEKKLKSPLGQAINYANLGSIFESRGQIDSAWKYFEHSMRYNSEAKSDLGVSLCYTHFGRLYEKQHLYDKAIDEYSKAYQIMEKSSDSWHWLESCLALSRVYIEKKDYSTARIYLSKAMNTARKIGAIGLNGQKSWMKLLQLGD